MQPVQQCCHCFYSNDMPATISSDLTAIEVFTIIIAIVTTVVAMIHHNRTIANVVAMICHCLHD